MPKKGPIISVANLDHRAVNATIRVNKALTEGNRSTGFGGLKNTGIARSALDDHAIKPISQFGYNTPSYYATPRFDHGFRTEEERERQAQEAKQRYREEKIFNIYTKLRPLPLESPRSMATDLKFEVVATKAPEATSLASYGKRRLGALQCVEASIDSGPNSARHLGPPALPALHSNRVQSTTNAAARMEKMVDRVPKPPRINPLENVGNGGGGHFTQRSFTKVVHTSPLAPIKPRKTLVSVDQEGKPALLVREMGRNITNQVDIPADDTNHQHHHHAHHQQEAEHHNNSTAHYDDPQDDAETAEGEEEREDDLVVENADEE